jgi:acyl-CoA synthetase (AMP-forming)/AMP-acid ligase II/thioesterase domain-containing protein
MSNQSAEAVQTRPAAAPTLPIAEAIAAHAIASPDRIALFDGTTKLTWQALIAWAAALAEEIEALSDPASRIGIFLPGSAGYIVAILALQMAGRTAVPINHGDPDQRVGRIIGRSDLAAVIVDPDTAPLMRRTAPNLRQILAAPAPGTISVASPHCAEIPPDHIFMISFTSGSTDEPKGVCWSEKSFSARLECFVPALPLTLDDRVPILESATSAHSVKVALASLFVGAPLVIFDIKRLGLGTTRRLLAEFRPTVYSVVPSNFRALFRPDDPGMADLVRDVRWVRFGRERVLYSDVELYRQRFPETCRLVIAVGATETSTFASWCIDHATPLDPALIPVGLPPQDVTLELLGDDGASVGPGEIGEIFVTSPTLAAGYWRDEALTQARFGPSIKFPGKNRFRTGDFGRFLPDGMLEFIGRRDRQVKIRGNTVNLGEVEAVLAGCIDVAEASVIARQRADETTLAAYYAPMAGSAIAEDVLRRWCRSHLSAPMRPTHFLMMAALPRLPSGKVDLVELAALDAQQLPPEPPALTPENAAATALSSIVRQAWSSILSAQSFDADDAFDAAGGDSLKGLELLVRLEGLLGRPIPIGVLGLETRPSELVERLAQTGETAPIPDDTRPHIVFFPGMWGDDINTSDFCRLLSSRFQVMAIDPRLGGDALTGDYSGARYFSAAIDAIRRSGPHPRLWMVGFSFGGKLAAETARRLLLAGTAVEAVVILDGEVGHSSRRLNRTRNVKRAPIGTRLRTGLATHGGATRYLLNAIASRTMPIAVRHGADRIVRAQLGFVRRFGSAQTYRDVSRAVVSQTRRRAFGDLPAGSLPMPLTLLISDDPWHDPSRLDLNWGDHCEAVHKTPVGGTHLTMLSPPTSGVVAAELGRLDDRLRPGYAARRHAFQDAGA